MAVSFDLPARQALVPNLVPAQDLPSAFSMQSIAFNIGAIVGPALSGVVIATLGQEYTYFINAVSFLAVIARPAADRARPAAGRRAGERPPDQPGGDPRGRALHPPSAGHPVQHDPGFLRHLFLIRQHPAAVRRPGHPEGGCHCLRLAVGCPVDRRGGSCTAHLAARPTSAGRACSCWVR